MANFIPPADGAGLGSNLVPPLLFPLLTWSFNEEKLFLRVGVFFSPDKICYSLLSSLTGG